MIKEKGLMSTSCQKERGKNVWSGHQQWQHGQTSSLDHTGQYSQNKHWKDPIIDSDLQKLYRSDVFDTNKPKSLQRNVFLELEYYFCRRAMENLRALTTKSFVVKTDENENEYVALDIKEFEKIHGAFDEDYDGGIMYSTGTESCPVLSFKKYISKLNPSIDTLFQRPRSEATEFRPWYDAQVLGITYST